MKTHRDPLFRHMLWATMFLSMLSSCSTITLTNLSVEMQDGQQPLATATPRFSWNYESNEDNVVQTSYRIIVSSSEEKARRGEGDLWEAERGKR